MTKQCYFTRLLVHIYPRQPGFKEAQWITSEDVNVEHLLDIFTVIDMNSKRTLEACSNILEHLYWYKPRLVVLGPKIEVLPGDHPFKAECLQKLFWFFDSIGNQVERKLLPISTTP